MVVALRRRPTGYAMQCDKLTAPAADKSWFAWLAQAKVFIASSERLIHLGASLCALDLSRICLNGWDQLAAELAVDGEWPLNAPARCRILLRLPLQCSGRCENIAICFRRPS